MNTLADRYPGAQPFGDTALDRLRFRGRDTESELLLHQLAGANLLVWQAGSRQDVAAESAIISAPSRT
jgi:hypothetical protein